MTHRVGNRFVFFFRANFNLVRHLTFVFYPFAGTLGGADYEQFWHLGATLLPVGFWFFVSRAFGSDIALCTWIGSSEE